MSEPIPNETQKGLADLEKRLSSATVQIIERHKNVGRRSMYLIIGAPQNSTTIDVPYSFLDDLPRNRENQAAVDSYAAVVGGRLSCGSPDVFFCWSGVPVRILLQWPIEHTITAPGRPVRWISIGVTNLVTNEVAQCSMEIKSFYPRMQSNFDIARTTVNSARKAIDGGGVKFFDPEVQQDAYQRVDHVQIPKASMSPAEVQRFITAKALSIGFNIPGTFTDFWPTDPWDAEYLGATTTDLLFATRVLRERSLLEESHWNKTYFHPTDKLLAASVEVENDDGFQIQKQITRHNLPNKEVLVKDINSVLKRHVIMGLVLVDLDNFKTVNDTNGHSEGDICLDKVVSILGEVIGRKGRIYRWGGDEFAICLPDFSTEEALVTAERIRRAVEETKPGGKITVTMSVGVYATDRQTDVKTADEILRFADKALYESKQQGRNRVTVWPFEAQASLKK